MPSTPSQEQTATASSDASARSAAPADLQRLTLVVATPAADAARAELADLFPAGWLEQESGADTTFRLWAPASDRDAAGDLRGALAGVGIAADVTSAPEGDDWRDGLRRHHLPVEVAGRVRVRPPWVAPAAGLVDVVIEPAMAFGTGQHATTKGCLDLLVDAPGGSLLDVGCGSGVLAIAARKLGYGPVTGVDNDPLAVEATIDNAAANGVDVAVVAGDADRDPLPQADTLVANILAIPVIALAAALGSPPPRRVVLSGFRPAEAGAVTDAWERRGFTVDRRIDEDDWTALRMIRT